MTATSLSLSVVIRLRVESFDEHWRDEPWVYAKAIKWYEEEQDALVEADRLNNLHDDPLYVYFVSCAKPGHPG